MAKKHSSASEIGRPAGDAINELFCLANSGDEMAALELWRIAAISSSFFNRLLPRAGPLLRAAIEESASIPTNFSINRKTREEFLAKCQKLGLAKRHALNVTGKYGRDSRPTKAAILTYEFCKRHGGECWRNSDFQEFTDYISTAQLQWSLDVRSSLDCQLSPEGQWLFTVHWSLTEWSEWVEKHASKIPRYLTRDNAREWADHCEPLLELFYGKQIEDHPHFANYLRSHGEKARGEILRVWRQSWHSIANP